MDRLVPVVDDRDTGGFFRAAAEGRLALRVCSRCQTVLHLPRAYCHRCGTWSEEWKEVTPAGTLVTWTTVAHQVHPAFPVPYTIVLVELDDAPHVRLVGNLAGAPELAAGQRMEAWFEDLGGGVTIPQWRTTA